MDDSEADELLGRWTFVDWITYKLYLAAAAGHFTSSSFTRDPRSLERSIALCQSCIKRRPNAVQRPKADALMALCYMSKFHYNLEYATISKAIAHARKGLEGAFAGRPLHVTCLVAALRDRLVYFGSEQDADGAILLLRQSLKRVAI